MSDISIDTSIDADYLENDKITILSILPYEDKCKVKKHIFFYKKEDNNSQQGLCLRHNYSQLIQ